MSNDDAISRKGSFSKSRRMRDVSSRRRIVQDSNKQFVKGLKPTKRQPEPGGSGSPKPDDIGSKRLAKVKYVVGFLFDTEKRSVVLIRKNKPEWQKGRWNGVGGKVEAFDFPDLVTPNLRDDLGFENAMEREFYEETGVRITDWKHQITLNFPNAEVRFFKAFSRQAHQVETKTRELVNVIPLVSLGKYNLMHNIQWLVGMCLDPNIKQVQIINGDFE